MGKAVLITGASSGIGEGIARELGASGANVLLGARRCERIEKIASDIRSAGGVAETSRRWWARGSRLVPLCRR